MRINLHLRMLYFLVIKRNGTLIIYIIMEEVQHENKLNAIVDTLRKLTLEDTQTVKSGYDQSQHHLPLFGINYQMQLSEGYYIIFYPDSSHKRVHTP